MESSCGTSMCTCSMTLFGSSFLFFFFLHLFLSYSCFKQLKNSIFIFLYRVYQLYWP
jgi:hypothetical protein